MGYKTKVQSIKRKTSEQWYINFPMALAHALEFEQSEEVEWVIAEDGTLILTRPNASKRTAVKKRRKVDRSISSFVGRVPSSVLSAALLGECRATGAQQFD